MTLAQKLIAQYVAKAERAARDAALHGSGQHHRELLTMAALNYGKAYAQAITHHQACDDAWDAARVAEFGAKVNRWDVRADATPKLARLAAAKVEAAREQSRVFYLLQDANRAADKANRDHAEAVEIAAALSA
jgi:L-arabinose isomerase